MNRNYVFRRPLPWMEIEKGEVKNAYSIMISYGGGMGGGNSTLYSYSHPLIEGNLIHLTDIYGVPHTIGINALVKISAIKLVLLDTNLQQKISYTWFEGTGKYRYFYPISITDNATFENTSGKDNPVDNIGYPLKLD